MKHPFTIKFWLLIFISITISIFYGWVDTRPSWDDTGITVFAVLLTTFVFGMLQPRYAWLWAIIIGSGIALFDAILSHNYGAMMVLVFAFAGAYSGALFKRIIV
jgi:hypothetical protein